LEKIRARLEPKAQTRLRAAFGLSHQAEANEDSVEDLSDTDQAVEAAAVEGVEDAADHPERPTHTHEEYGRPDDVHREIGTTKPREPSHQSLAMKKVQRHAGPSYLGGGGQAASREAECA
jgi:hypothetical protein